MSTNDPSDVSRCCPTHGLFETLAKPWTLHIIWTLNQHGEMRFGALRRAIAGISSRVLTERLRELEEKRFVHRDYKPTIPPQVSYRLTERMEAFHIIMAQLETLSRTWAEEDAVLTKQSGNAEVSQQGKAEGGMM